MSANATTSINNWNFEDNHVQENLTGVYQFYRDPDSPDTIIACFTLEARCPANNIELRLVI